MPKSAATPVRKQAGPSAAAAWLVLCLVFFAVQFASLFTPPVLDDVDASHAQAAQHMAQTGNLVTLYVNGIRYLEKPPLPYWLTAGFFKTFGENVFAVHLTNALSVLACAWLAWLWAGRAWGRRAGFYAGLGVLTSVGIFLFTRFFIPEALLSFLLLFALYSFLAGLEAPRRLRFYGMWAALAFATLAKGLIAPVFFIAAAVPFLVVSGLWRRWRETKPFSGVLLFLAIAAPWHILAGLANPDQGHPVGNHPTPDNVHGFWYFYFLNEHVFRFLGTRFPHDYNRMSPLLYWLGHLAWLFPWSLFLPALVVVAWRTRRTWLPLLRRGTGRTINAGLKYSSGENPGFDAAAIQFRVRSAWLLGIYSAFVLLFFSLSTNQEYYTFPAWPTLLILIAGILAGTEERRATDGGKPVLSTRWLTGAQAVFAIAGATAAAALCWGLWESRHLPFVSDIGTLLAHRDVGGYTLATSHFFDLTGPSFAALRLPASLAAVTLLVGPAVSWILRLREKHLAATTVLALTSAVFLVAAHIAFARFNPMLSSKLLADEILAKGSPADTFIIYGDQSDASSVVFYTHNFLRKPAYITGFTHMNGKDVPVEACSPLGAGSSLVWGSCWPDAPKIFLSPAQVSAMWGTGPRKWIFAQDTNEQRVEHLLAGRLYPVRTIADKELWTDRPLP